MIRPDIIIRRFKRNIGLKAVNIFCLSIAFACLIMLIAYVTFEKSYDKFHPNANRIVRLTESPRQGLIDARIYTNPEFHNFLSGIPGIETVCRIATIKQAVITVSNKRFNLNRFYYVDSSFFKVFNYKIKTGDQLNPIPTNRSIIVSENFARKYFGTEDIIGKTIKIAFHQVKGENDFTVSGIMYNCPDNSHFKAEALIAMPKDFQHFAYTYLQLQSDDKSIMTEKLTAIYNEAETDSSQTRKIELQPITEIHLHSNKARELERNGSYQSMILIISAVLLIVLIALINLSNNSRVLFLQNRDYYVLKRTHGASIGIVILEEVVQILILSASIILIGFWFVYYLNKLLGINSFSILSVTDLIFISVLFALVLLIVMIIPVLRYFVKDFFSWNRNIENTFLSKSKSLAMRGFIIAQVTISVFVIIMTMGISKQMNYVLETQLGGDMDSIIVLPNQPEQALRNFDQLKEELLSDPKILGFTAAMEPPADAIKDRANFTLEGKEQESAIDILCIDCDFFNFFGLKVIEGNMLPRYPYSYNWEMHNVEAAIGMLPGVKPEKLDEFSDNFLINRKALTQLGFSTPEEAIGKRIRLTNHPILDMIPGGKIVGVVEDFKYTSMFEKERPMLIMQRRLFIANFLIRYDPNYAKEALSSIREKWQKINPDYPFNYETLPETYKNVYYNEFNTKRFLTYFSLLSLIISSLGLVVMMSFYIRYRLKEIGIRKVNGAKTADILILLNKDLVVWVIIAFCIATPLAFFALKKWLQGFAYQTSISWWVFVGAGILALIVALITVSWQSLKAARMNPVDAIRYE
ncbi:MAG: ABC transporter permease [Tenuifilaceae bacterium]